MSDALNHYYCGEYALNNVNNQIRHIINKNRKIYDLGTQGPDFFFYDGVLPWKKSKGLNNYGTILHTNSTNMLFYVFLKTAQSIKDKENFNKAFSLICGTICHLSLDSYTHPYINYISGIYKEDVPETHVYKYCHKKNEIALDILFCDYLNKKPAVSYPIEHIFNISEEDIKTVHCLYKSILKKYNKPLSLGGVMHCLKEAVQTQKIITDKSGIKTFLLSYIEKIIKKPYAFTRALYTRKAKEENDFLNIEKRTWYNPYNKIINSNNSYPELFELACNDAVIKINQVYDIIKEEITLKKIDEVFRDVSFETGL